MSRVEVRKNSMDGVHVTMVNTHKVVERHIAADPEGVGALLVDANRIDLHEAVIEQAGRQGIAVRIDPRTAELVTAEAPKLPYGADEPVDLAAFASRSAVDQLTDRVLSVQQLADVMTPPSFHAGGDTYEQTMDVNLRLVAATRRRTDDTIIPILHATRQDLARHDLEDLAARLGGLDVETVELRLSPLKHSAGVTVVQSVIEICQRLNDAGLEVLVGHNPTIGAAAYASGVAVGYSTGVLERQTVDTSGLFRRRNQPGGGGGGGGKQVYFHALGVKMPEAAARKLLKDRQAGSMLRCRHDVCASSATGAADRYREHDLHTRVGEFNALAAIPHPLWRTQQHATTVSGQLDAQEQLAGMLPEDVTQPKAPAVLPAILAVLKSRAEAEAA